MADLKTGAITITAPTTDGTGYVGGSKRTAADHPFLSGNLYVFFGFPGKILTGTANMEATHAQGTLLTAAEEYTPHADAQIKVVDVEGQGGVGASFIAGRTNSREFTILYKDFWKAPVFRIHRRWGFINPWLGGSDIAGDYSAMEYKGTCMVIQTKPVVRTGTSADDGGFTNEDIIKIAYYDGVFPKVDLSAVYSANIAENTLIKPSVPYSFDGVPLDETNTKVLEAAVTILNTQEVFAQIADTYSKLLESATGDILGKGNANDGKIT